MASTLMLSLSARLTSRIAFKELSCKAMSYHTTGVRCLFSAEYLGIPTFIQRRTSLQENVEHLREVFCQKMEEYMDSSAENTIFTEDLKTVIHMAENREELETALKMIRRYHLQDDILRQTNYRFGPVVMRLLYVLKKPKKAIELVQDEVMAPFFNHMSAMLTFVDLLFEEGFYQEIIDLTPELKNRLADRGTRNTNDLLTIFAAACLKVNNSESYDEMLKMMSNLNGRKLKPSPCTVIYASQLALNQGEVKTAFELLSLISGSMLMKDAGYCYAAYHTLKAITLSRLGRIKEAIHLVSNYINRDTSSFEMRYIVIFPELMAELSAEVEASKDKAVLKDQLDLLRKQIEERSSLTKQTFDSYIFSPIGHKKNVADAHRGKKRSSSRGTRQSCYDRLHEHSLDWDEHIH